MFKTIDLFRKFWSTKELSSKPDLNNPQGLQIVATYDDDIDDEEEEVSVDIVAVHGLGGHAYDTWTHDNGIMWLRDLLPQDIPNARVMTWGYDSEPQTAKHFTHMMMYSHPDNLLSALYSLRQATNSNNRPIIFICHSLGGVVVKEALVRASMAIPKNKKHLKAIQICTKGIIFLGTPHQSTQEISFGKIIRRLASVTLRREGILTSLETASNRLELQLEQFKSVCTGLSNYYCYERQPTRDALEVNLIMSKASSTLGSLVAEDPHCVGINKDHRNLVKYQSSEDPDYRVVLDLVCRLGKNNGGREHLEERANRAQINYLNHFTKASFKVPATLDHHRNKSFTGRKEALAQLHSYVSNSHFTSDRSSVVVIRGLGGIGKTQLALECIYRYESSFDSVWWIDAQSLQSTQTGFFNMAQRLGEYYANNPEIWAPSIADISRSLKKAENSTDGWGKNQVDMKTPNLIVEAVKEWLCCKGNDRWLLVLDNVDDLNSFNIADFLPQTRSGNIIMTSRCKDIFRFGQEILLNVMEASESIDLLFKSCQREIPSSDVPDYSQARELVAMLGHLPLAIAQAGAYISSPGISFASFLREFKERASLDDTVFSSRLSGPEAVHTTLKISFQSIKKENPQAADLLLLCSFLASENIPEEMLSSGLHLKRQGESSLESQLSILRKYSLITPSERIESFDIHFLVHRWARDRQTPDQRRCNVEKAVVALATAADAVQEPESRRRVFERRILPHIRHCLDYLLPVSVSSVGYRYWSILGSVCKHQDQNEVAESLYRYTIQDLDGKPALESEKEMAFLQIASIFIASGKVSEAEKLSRLVLDRTGERNLRLLSRINLASACKSQSRFHEAEQYMKDAIYQCEDIFGPNNLRTLRLVDDLATMYRERGRYARAEMLLRRELLSSEALVGTDHPETVMAQGKLASVFEEQGKYEEAEALLERSLNVHERVLGYEHPKTLSVVASLAVLYDLQGSFAESQPLYIRALEGKERMLGSSHPAVLDIRENMALGRHMQGRDREAEEILRSVLEARSSQTHKDEDIERVQMRLAELHKQRGSGKY